MGKPDDIAGSSELEAHAEKLREFVAQSVEKAVGPVEHVVWRDPAPRSAQAFQDYERRLLDGN